MDLAASFVAGLLSWTFLEYVIHHWLGHLPRGRTLISSEHLAHHADILYFTPLPTKVRGAVPVLAVVGVGVGLVSGVASALAFTAAVVVGWTGYEVLHQSIHVHGPRNPYARWAARYHLHHHFARADRNHGVTTPLWDLVLGTYDAPGRVRVTRRQRASVPWLRDVAEAMESGAPAPAWLADYELR